MIDKIVGILDKYGEYTGIAHTAISGTNYKIIAKEIHALRYEVARQVMKEYNEWLSEWDGDYPAPQEYMALDDWLSEQGEDVTIDLREGK